MTLAAAAFFACGSAGSMSRPADAAETDKHLSIGTGRSSTVDADMRRLSYKGQELVIVREAKTGVTWWTTAEQIFDDFPDRSVYPNDSAMVFTGHKLVRFTLVIPELLVGESAAVFPSLDAAEHEIVAGKAPLERWLTPRLSLPRDFLVVPNLAHSPSPRIRSVAITTEGWLITLGGPNGDFADVTLDHDFHVTNVRRYE